MLLTKFKVHEHIMGKPSRAGRLRQFLQWGLCRLYELAFSGDFSASGARKPCCADSTTRPQGVAAAMAVSVPFNTGLFPGRLTTVLCSKRRAPVCVRILPVGYMPEWRSVPLPACHANRAVAARTGKKGLHLLLGKRMQERAGVPFRAQLHRSVQHWLERGLCWESRQKGGEQQGFGRQWRCTIHLLRQVRYYYPSSC